MAKGGCRKGQGGEGLGMGNAAARPLACERGKESNVVSSRDRDAAGSYGLFLCIRESTLSEAHSWESGLWAAFCSVTSLCSKHYAQPFRQKSTHAD
jgi:hypothetical protein